MSWLDETVKNQRKEIEKKKKEELSEKRTNELNQKHFNELVVPYMEQIKKAVDEANSQLIPATKLRVQIETRPFGLRFLLVDDRTEVRSLEKRVFKTWDGILEKSFSIDTSFGKRYVNLHYHGNYTGALYHIQPYKLSKEHVITMAGVISEKINLKTFDKEGEYPTHSLFRRFSGLLSLPRFFFALIERIMQIN